MSLQLTSAPAVEPVTLSDAKQHLRIDTLDDDAFIAALITTARLQIEAVLGQALITQTWLWHLDDLPADNILHIPLAPLQTVTSFHIVHADGTETDATSHVVASDTDRIRLTRPAATNKAPFGAYLIHFTAGHGDLPQDVPAPIRTALLQLVAHWYEHRGPAEVGDNAPSIPAVISQLLAPYKSVHLT